MDEADRAHEHEHVFIQEALSKFRKPLEEGKPGDCDLCGEHSMRLVNGVCAPCRDKYKLP